jgi:hypothetical protein
LRPEITIVTTVAPDVPEVAANITLEIDLNTTDFRQGTIVIIIQPGIELLTANQ